MQSVRKGIYWRNYRYSNTLFLDIQYEKTSFHYLPDLNKNASPRNNPIISPCSLCMHEIITVIIIYI